MAGQCERHAGSPGLRDPTRVRACPATVLWRAWSSPGAPHRGRRVAGQQAGASRWHS
nr:hypothetical protein [Kibdelosporangium sp. MJ126-NF4]